MNPPYLEINDLTVVFNRGQWNEHRVFEHLDLSFAEGELVVLTGANGSGKSTLLKSLAGDLGSDVANGMLRLNGEDLGRLDSWRRAQRISVIDQDPTAGTCEHLLVEEQLRLAGERIAQRVRTRLANLGSTIDTAQPVRSLSGGQRQLLTVLMAVEKGGALLLVDEPTAALDRHFAPLVLELLSERANRPGCVTLLVTHHDNIEDKPGLRRVNLDELTQTGRPQGS